ncbi:MAG: T9SS type A sorting domain-containing protein [Ignavibacteria bacterium]|nr:T9SS type A sorting domain-containing protein [Ignavibacteria bacterium]
MKKNILLFAFVLIANLNFSFAQNTKAYILSEGNGSPGSGKLSAYTYNGGAFSLSITSNGNLGLYPDGILKFNSSLFVLEQGGFGGQGKIYKMDSAGAIQNSQSFGANPYSLTASNNKIYVTNGPASKVTILNMSNFSVIKELTVGSYPQEILGYQNRVFVCNTSAFGGARDSSVSIINSQTDSVIGRIYFSTEPTSLAISNDGKLLVGCNGYYGKIYKIDPNTFQTLDTYVLNQGFDKDISVDKNSDNVYYIDYSNNISRLNLSTGSENTFINNPATSFIYFYGYNYDYSNNKHFICDAKNFTVSGSLFIYGGTGNLEQSFTTGIAPRRVIFDRTSTVNINQISEIASGYSLKQNYPNPFNPFTKIIFSIPKNEQVSLKIYDSNGREINTILDEAKAKGTYEVSYNGSELSSGVYFYKLNTPSFSSVKKMTLVK